MKKIYTAAAVFIAVSSLITVFSACQKKVEEETTTLSVPTYAFSTNVDGTAYSLGDDGYKYVINTQTQADIKEKTTQNQTPGHTVMTLTTVAITTGNNKKNEANENKTEKATAEKNNISNETVKNESKGINVLIKSDAVPRGSSATVTIMGEAGKTYSIEFYKNGNTVSTANGLSNIKADENGMATWTFEVESDCESGNRKVIIKEKGSDNFVQTSINIK